MLLIHKSNGKSMPTKPVKMERWIRGYLPGAYHAEHHPSVERNSIHNGMENELDELGDNTCGV
jgi:hypothetical protein